MMKFRHARAGDSFTIFLAGDIEASTCTCLERFWERFVPTDIRRLIIDLSDTRSVDASSRRFLQTQLEQAEQTGLEVECLGMDRWSDQ